MGYTKRTGWAWVAGLVLLAATAAWGASNTGPGTGGGGGSATNVYLYKYDNTVTIITNAPGNWSIRVNTNTPMPLNGSFLGDGSNLTNLNTAKITPSGTVLSPSDSQATINAAVAAGGTIWWNPGDYNSLSNLYPVSNSHWIGYGAILHLGSTYTNFMVDTGSNVNHFVIEGMKFTGDKYPTYSTPGYFSPYNGLYEPYYSTTWTNRHGLRLNGAVGNSAHDCVAYGFGGSGFMIASTNNSGAQYYPTANFYNNIAYSNYCGFMVLGPSYEYAGWPNSGIGGTGKELSDEYQIISGCQAIENGIGIVASAGNAKIIGNRFTGNFMGILGSTVNNAMHGRVIGNSFNHCNIGIRCEGQNDNIVVSQNEFIGGSQLDGTSTNQFDGVQYLEFSGNFIGGSPFFLNVTNDQNAVTTLAYIYDNLYPGTWGTDVILNTNLGAGKLGYVWYWGNHSESVSNNTDGSASSVIHNTGIAPRASNSTYATNLAPGSFVSSSFSDASLNSGAAVRISGPSGNLTLDSAPTSNPVVPRMTWDGDMEFTLGSATNDNGAFVSKAVPGFVGDGSKLTGIPTNAISAGFFAWLLANFGTGGGGSATNAIGNLNGIGTNATVLGSDATHTALTLSNLSTAATAPILKALGTNGQVATIDAGANGTFNSISASNGATFYGSGPWVTGSNAVGSFFAFTNGSGFFSNVYSGALIFKWDTNGNITANAGVTASSFAGGNLSGNSSGLANGTYTYDGSGGVTVNANTAKSATGATYATNDLNGVAVVSYSKTNDTRALTLTGPVSMGSGVVSNNFSIGTTASFNVFAKTNLVDIQTNSVVGAFSMLTTTNMTFSNSVVFFQLDLKAGTLLFTNLGGAGRSLKIDPSASVTADTNVVFNGNGYGLTNIQSLNVYAVTNTYYGTVVDFSKGTEVTTNLAGNLTFTGVTAFNATNYNWQIIHCYASGADRTIAPSAGWRSQGTCVCTNGTSKDVLIECQLNVFTNMSWKSEY